MAPGSRKLRVFFFPVLAPGHIIPAVDLAKLMASRGVDCTIVTTPANVPFVQPALDRFNLPVGVLLLPFPAAAAGLPDGCENFRSVPPGLYVNFVKAVGMLRDPFDRLLRDHLPDAIVTDVFLPWTADVARELGIPRLVFHGMSFFALCAGDSVRRLAPAGNLPDGVESFVLPELPHRVEMLRTQMPELPPESVETMNRIRDSEAISYGVVVNSFYELEPAYAEHYRNVVGRKAWHVGPVSPCSKDAVDVAVRGGEASADGADCLSWLGAQKPNSVLYVCFGSLTRFPAAQLREIAGALEASGHPFIWVVGYATGGGSGEESEWMPDGFQERIEKGNKGLIVRGWVPQVAILNHDAVGGFMTHCGWNSSLEGIAAGVPMVTWPLFAEQFYNERLIVDVLRVGVGVGARQFTMRGEDHAPVKAEAIEAAVARVMGGGVETGALRRRAQGLGEAARRAVEEDGSSFADTDRLIDELQSIRPSS